jgi:acetolactate synthase I/II/III large subunit
MPDPTPAASLTVAQCLLKYLQLEGVDTIFGIPGGALMTILDELMIQRDRFRYVVTRHETGAVFAADGYARATGKLGVALVTAGPGATNALTGTMNAQNSCTSVLTLTGEVPETTFGRGYLQEGIDANLNIDAIYRNATQYSAVIVNGSSAQTLIAQALRDCRSRPPRASHLSIPDDVAASPLGPNSYPTNLPTSPTAYRAEASCNDPARTLNGLQQLLAADRPLLFLGNGTRSALAQGNRRAELIALVERFGLPVVTSPEGKGVFPESHPLSLRSYGLAGAQWAPFYLMPPGNPNHFDSLLVIASSLQELTTNKWNPILVPNGPFVQVDLDQSMIGRGYNITQGIVAEAGAFLDDFIKASQTFQPDAPRVTARKELIARIKADHSPVRDPEKYASNAAPIYPQALMRCLAEQMPGDAMLFFDSANCLGWGYQYLVIDPPREFHSSLDMGPMGVGVCSVVGAKIGRPDRTCIAVVGDGAFLMHGSEVSTAAEQRAGAIWVVLDDNDLGMVSQGMNEYFPNPIWKHYYHFNAPDLAKFAEALGADGYHVHDPAEMTAAFAKALEISRTQGKPQVIVAHINRNEVPPYYPPK